LNLLYAFEETILKIYNWVIHDQVFIIQKLMTRIKESTIEKMETGDAFTSMASRAISGLMLFLPLLYTLPVWYIWYKPSIDRVKWGWYIFLVWDNFHVDATICRKGFTSNKVSFANVASWSKKLNRLDESSISCSRPWFFNHLEILPNEITSLTT